jgi:NAD(P)-dependent dehydrogenase (short-subunit alcohol dehydrogenase family)
MADALRFDGRVVVVTGAGRGVGRGHALDLGRRGARVVVADFGGDVDGTGASSGPADDVVREITGAGGEAVACYASVAVEAEAASIIETALDSYGRLDAVINNAGISAPDRFEDLSLEQYHRLMDVHYFGTVHVLRAAWPHLRAAGYGRIVNTCSDAMTGNSPKQTTYSAAKGAVYGLTRSLASEGPKYGILVNGVVPRANTRMATPETLSHMYGVAVDQAKESMTPYRPELVSPAAVFLAHESCALNGEILMSGGGHIGRLFVSETQGINKEDVTAEDVAAQLDVIMDTADASVLGLMLDH